MCHMTLTYLFSAKVTPPMKIAFFPTIRWFVRKPSKLLQALQWTAIREVDFPTAPNLAPNFTTFPHLVVESKTRTNEQKLHFPLSNDKILQ